MGVSNWKDHNKTSSAWTELHLTQVPHSLAKTLTKSVLWIHDHTKIRTCKRLTNTREHNIHLRCFIPAFCYSPQTLMGNTKPTRNNSPAKGLWIIMGHKLNMKYPCHTKRQTEPWHARAAVWPRSLTKSSLWSAQASWGLHWSGFWYWQLISERRWRCCRQHRANRMIRGLWDMTYKERLKELGYFA